MNTLDGRSGGSKPRVVLVTNGLRPVMPHFPTIGGEPVGIIAWHGACSGRSVDALTRVRLLARLYAHVRGRRYGSLFHFCREHNLKYARIHKSNVDDLKQTLAQWQTDLVIASGCPMIPLDALNSVKYGGINLHPSVLPAYRGADPLAWQVIDQVEKMGVTVHRLSGRFDSGCILAQTELSRPRGASRKLLMQQLEGDAGVGLLKELTEKLVNDEKLQGWEQPENGPIRLANRLSIDEVGRSWSLETLTAEALWDILQFYGQCPSEWLALSGWRKRLKWRPVSFNEAFKRERVPCSPPWRVQVDGAAIRLVHQTATIELGSKVLERLNPLKSAHGQRFPANS